MVALLFRCFSQASHGILTEWQNSSNRSPAFESHPFSNKYFPFTSLFFWKRENWSFVGFLVCFGKEDSFLRTRMKKKISHWWDCLTIADLHVDEAGQLPAFSEVWHVHQGLRDGRARGTTPAVRPETPSWTWEEGTGHSIRSTALNANPHSRKQHVLSTHPRPYFCLCFVHDLGNCSPAVSPLDGHNLKTGPNQVVGVWGLGRVKIARERKKKRLKSRCWDPFKNFKVASEC